MKQNARLKQEAMSRGFTVIDTLQMTLSRYREFLQGKCACHFHQVCKHINQTKLSVLEQFCHLLMSDEPYHALRVALSCPMRMGKEFCEQVIMIIA